MFLNNTTGKVLAMVLILLLIIFCIPMSGCSGTDSSGLNIEQNSKVAGTVNKSSLSIRNLIPASLPGAGSGIRPIAVMVENSFAARPQSGLIFADVVYEVVDEYGITRFVAIFASNEAPVVGPVRSTRNYYAEIARAFDPIYAFFGTYPQCYGYVESLGMYVLSAMTDRSGHSSITGQARTGGIGAEAVSRNILPACLFQA